MKMFNVQLQRFLNKQFLLTVSLVGLLSYLNLLSLQQIWVTLSLTSVTVLIIESRLLSNSYLLGNPIAILSIVLISFLFPISNLTRWMLLLTYSVTSIFLGSFKGKISIKYICRLTNISLIAIIFTSLMTKASNYSFQFLGYGYDNAFHFAIYRYFRSSPWFPFGFEPSWGTDFEMFHTYPTGQAALWSFLAEPLIGNSLDPLQNLAAYSCIVIICFIALNYLTYRIIRPIKNVYTKVAFGPMTLSLLINICISAILVTNGFVPYFIGLIILLVFIDSLTFQRQFNNSTLLIALMILIFTVVSPALLAFLVLPAMVITFLETKKMIISYSYLRLTYTLFFCLNILFIVLLLTQRTSSIYGWRQILAVGGIRQPSIIQFAIILFGYFSALFLMRKSRFTDTLSLVSLSGLASVITLVSITIIYTGSIQYYALKQAYVWCTVSSIVISRYLFKSKVNNRLRKVVLIVWMMVLVLPNVAPRALNSGYMSTLTGSVTNLLRTSEWDLQIISANRILETLESSPTETSDKSYCLLFRHKPYESDLASRWLNSLTAIPNISNVCFEGFWNSTPLSLLELITRLSKLPGRFVIIIDPSQEKDIPTNLPINTQLIILDLQLS